MEAEANGVEAEAIHNTSTSLVFYALARLKPPPLGVAVNVNLERLVTELGRIRPPLPGEAPTNIIVTEGKRVHSEQGGNSHSFQILYQPDAANQELFSKTVQPLLDLFIAGFNTSILVYGESGSGKTFTTVGEQGGQQPGIAPQAISYVTSNIQQQNSQHPESSFPPSDTSPRLGEERGRLLMYSFEIHNEIIKDLIASRGALSGRNLAGPMELEYTPERGMFVKNLQYEVCRNPNEAVTSFFQSWLTRNTSTSDFGAAKIFTTYILQLELFMMTDENPLPNRSTFTLIRLPGAEKLAEDSSRSRVREGPTLSKSIVAFNKLTSDLARQPDPRRVINYSDSKLTSLLESTLGGNCKTRVICCLPANNKRPEVMASVLTGCGLLAQVKNYPIINDCLAQDLVTQFRTRLDTKLQLGGGESGAGSGLMSRPELHDQLMKITSDNTQLRERNDRLFQRLEQLQDKMTDVAKSKSELSSKLVASEEEKLKVSKGLVEVQLENNRLTEEYEAENFELKNKLLNLENQLVEIELERNKYARTRDISAEHTKQLEENRRLLADEFIALKKKAQAQEESLKTQTKRNEEMKLELARLIETEAALLNIRDNVDRQRQVHDEASHELERARAVLRDAKIAATVDDNDDVLDKLRARRAELHREMWESSPANTPRDHRSKDTVVSKMKKTYDDQTKKLEARLSELKSQLATAYAGIQAANNKVAQQTTSVLSSKEDQERLAEENSRLQQQIKESGEEYRKRLWNYVQDIANFVDDGASKQTKPSVITNSTMKNYIDGMIQEMKSSFRSREEQLINAARNYKKQSKRVAQRHEKLLVHYRILRDQLQLLRSSGVGETDASGLDGPLSHLPPVDLGPDPADLTVTENELASENTLELNKLRTLLSKARAEAERAKAELKRKPAPNPSLNPLRKVGSFDSRDPYKRHNEAFDPHSTAQMERDRAELLTRATVAEQQAREQQEYIDTHLTRYRQEIVRLRKLLADRGVRVDEQPISPRYTPRKKVMGRNSYGF